MVYKSDEMVRESEGKGWEGERMVRECDGKVCEGEWVVYKGDEWCGKVI